MSVSLSFFFFSPLAIPRFGLLTQVNSLRLSSGHSGLVLTLSNAAYASRFSPRLLVADASIWATSPLRVEVRWVICEFYFFLSIMLPSETPKLPQRPASEKVSWCLETSLSQLPPRDRSPSLTLLSLFLSFIFCPTTFRRQWAAFLGAWCFLPLFRGRFVKFAQRSNDLLIICGGESGLPILFLHHLSTTLC